VYYFVYSSLPVSKNGYCDKATRFHDRNYYFRGYYTFITAKDIKGVSMIFNLYQKNKRPEKLLKCSPSHSFSATAMPSLSAPTSKA